MIAILGASGSGKSTFLRCINLLENPNEGEIIVAGEQLRLKRAKDGDLVAADAKQINQMRSKLGFVFQNFNLWPHMTVLENVMAPLLLGKRLNRTDARSLAEAALQRVGLAAKIGAYPARLSGGQQQR